MIKIIPFLKFSFIVFLSVFILESLIIYLTSDNTDKTHKKNKISVPVDIRFKGSSNDFLGKEPFLYKVRCSNNYKRNIYAFEHRKKWCTNKDKYKGKCFDDQLKSAKWVCKKTSGSYFLKNKKPAIVSQILMVIFIITLPFLFIFYIFSIPNNTRNKYLYYTKLSVLLPIAIVCFISSLATIKFILTFNASLTILFITIPMTVFGSYIIKHLFFQPPERTNDN